MDQPMIRNADGTLTPAPRVPMAPGIDFEVYGTGPFTWRAYRGHSLLNAGWARTRLGLRFALWREQRRATRRG